MELGEILKELVCKIVDLPDEVQVSEVKASRSSIYEIKVNPEDIGKVIGKGGRTVNALTTIMTAAAGTQDRYITIEIIQPF